MENIDWSKFNVKKNDEKQYEISKKRYIELINKLNKVNGVLISEFNGMGKLITVKIYDVIITKEAMYLFKNIDRIIDLKNEVVINNDIFLGLSQKENDKFGFRVKIKTYDDEFIEINTWDYKKFIKGRKTFYDKLNKNGDKALSGYKKTDISIKIFYKKCGHEEYITPELYCENSICPVCKKNMNTKYILDNYKEEAKLYFCDLNQLKNKVKSSKDSVDCKCKRCGRPIGKRQIKTVMDQHGLLCKSCGNGISMPNRIMFEILSELNINFETEKKFKWCRFYNKFIDDFSIGMYDFVIEDKKIIIEMDGGQHQFKSNFKGYSLEEIQFRDKNKTELAINNNYEIIRIDSYVKNCGYENIWDNIKKSQLSNYYDLSKINFDNILLKTQEDIHHKILNLWNKGYNVEMIEEELKGRRRVFIVKSLVTSNNLGLCEYNRYLSSVRRIVRPCILLKYEDIISIEPSYNSAKRIVEKQINKSINDSVFHENIKKNKRYKEYIIVDIPKDVYKEYIKRNHSIDYILEYLKLNN